MSQLQKDELMSSIVFQIHTLVILLDKVADHQLQAEFGLSLSQFLIMYIFRFMPEANQISVAQCLNMSAAAVSKQLDKLEKLDLLEKSNQQKDKRQHSWQISQKGQLVFAQAQARMDILSIDSQWGLTSEELTVFKSVLTKILNQSTDNYKTLFKTNC